MIEHSNQSLPTLKTQWMGLTPCEQVVQAMQAFTQKRQPDTPDELWLCEHPPTYTQGIAGKTEHLLNTQNVAVVQTNRGGQVTYHGPGQVVAYPLIDLKRLGIYVKEYVYRLEHAVLKTLESFAVTGHRVATAPGIYVKLSDPYGHSMLAMPRQDLFNGLGKIAAIGIKVSRHCTYHGLALNVAMNLSPFNGINPCGYAQLQTIDLAKIGVHTDWLTVAQHLRDNLALQLTA
jgi:lipoyl(octanoyl) transferase